MDSRQLASERHRAIMRALSGTEAVSVTALARLTGVSAVTIRRDLKELAHKGLVTRVHGGALRAPKRGTAHPFPRRRGRNGFARHAREPRHRRREGFSRRRRRSRRLRGVRRQRPHVHQPVGRDAQTKYPAIGRASHTPGHTQKTHTLFRPQIRCPRGSCGASNDVGHPRRIPGRPSLERSADHDLRLAQSKNAGRLAPRLPSAEAHRAGRKRLRNDQTQNPKTTAKPRRQGRRALAAASPASLLRRLGPEENGKSISGGPA